MIVYQQIILMANYQRFTQQKPHNIFLHNLYYLICIPQLLTNLLTIIVQITAIYTKNFDMMATKQQKKFPSRLFQSHKRL